MDVGKVQPKGKVVEDLGGDLLEQRDIGRQRLERDKANVPWRRQDTVPGGPRALLSDTGTHLRLKGMNPRNPTQAAAPTFSSSPCNAPYGHRDSTYTAP